MSKKHPPTDEQSVALKESELHRSFKMAAYAGAGKTSTLTLISEHLYNRFDLKGLYLAFNKTIADEAKEKLHSSVECRTFHSLAFRSAGKMLTDKIRYPKAYPSDLVHLYRARDVLLPVNEEEFEKFIKFKKSKNKTTPDVHKNGYHNFTAIMQMQSMNDSITAFCRSVDKEITIDHIRLPEWVSKQECEEINSIKKKLLGYTKQRWEELVDVRNTVAITHDVYLKAWAMTDPKIEADYILFDEAQDADAIQLQVLGLQKCPIFYVGDKHQSIYDWRGAINAMDTLDIPELRLTKSFRFGTEVAMFANKLLSMLGETVPLRGHSPIESKVHTQSKSAPPPDAILCRTNKGAFSELIDAIKLKDGRKYSIQANIEEILSFLINAKKLKDGKPTDHLELDNFDSWELLEEYAELNPTDQAVSGLVRIINEFGDVQMLIDNLEKCAETKDADCVICTAHKSKGLEWDNVKISSDFNLAVYEGSELRENLRNMLNIHDEQSDMSVVMRELKESITKMTESELRLIYVAVTRARKHVDVSNLMELFEAYDNGIRMFYEHIETKDLMVDLQ